VTALRLRTGAIIIAICVLLDQISKILIELYLPFQEIVSILPFTALFRTWNEGIAFSFLSGLGSWGLVTIAFIVVALVIWLWASSPSNRLWLDWGYAMIIGGAIGNLVDRMFYGHVVDVFLFHYGQWSFAVFNIADAFISIGVGVIILDEIRHALKSTD
jgi:signal peptidase II